MSIYKKLFEAKKGIGTIFKDSKNPFFKSNYLSLNGLVEAIEDVLNDNQLVLLQPIANGCVRTEIYDIESNESVFSEMTLPNITDPQKLGSAITYYRRYTLQSLLCLQAEDDDGNSATKQVKEQSKPTLDDDKFEKAKAFSKEHIQKCLNTFRMSPTQRVELEKLLK